MNVTVEPPSARYSIQKTLNGIRASVPARRSWFALLFMVAWLGGWVMGEVSAIGEIFHREIGFFGPSHKTSPDQASEQLFLAFWLVGWTIGGAFAFAVIIWQVFGREIIGVEDGNLIYRVEALGIGRTRAFTSAQIARLRAIDMDTSGQSRGSNWMRAPALFGQGTGSVAFDYGARGYRIGVSLDGVEARFLIDELKQWLPAGAVAP
jgi:hypothetical protein